MVSSASPQEAKATLAVGDALALEVGRVYRGILRRVYFEIKKMEEWMSGLGALKRPPSDELVMLAFNWREILNSFDKEVYPTG